MSSVRPKVLTIDDDPDHLEIYGLLAAKAGYEAVPVLVRFAGAAFAVDAAVTAILLDYRLNCFRPTSDIAQELRGLYPGVPIVLLSDLWSMPAEMQPYVSEFVRKGDPDRLMKVLEQLLPQEAAASEGAAERD